MHINLGGLLDAGPLHDAIKTLAPAIGLGGAMVSLRREFTDGFSPTRVVLGEVRQSPSDPRPSWLVFKIGPARALRDEVARYVRLRAHIRAQAAFAPIREADRMAALLPNDDTTSAICYEHAAAMLGATDCVPFRTLFRDGVTAAQPIERVEAVIDALGSVLMSLYGKPETDCFAWDAARYYLEHWAPDFRIAIDHVDGSADRPLLMLRRLNPAQFGRERATDSTTLRGIAESSALALPEVVLQTCSIAEVRDHKLTLHAPSAEDLALEIDLNELSRDARESLTAGATVSVWAPAKSSRHRFYQERLRAAIPDPATPTFDAGPLWLHQPLAYLSRALRDAMQAQPTWKVPSHGDLHGGNVLVVGSVPVIIDYGKAEEALPVGVDAARLVGTVVRDVLSELLTASELVAVLAHNLRLGHFVDSGNPRAERALRLLDRLTDRLLPGDPGIRGLWPAHLYGFAWIGLKWPGSEAAHMASHRLAAVALTRIMGLPTRGSAAPETTAAPVTSAKPPLIKPEGPAEILVLVARFAGSADYDPTTRVYTALCDHLFEVAPTIARVARLDQAVESRKDAIALAAKYSASVIVWGTFDNLGIRPRYEITRDSLVMSRSAIQLGQATRHELSEQFEPYVTNNLAAEISFLSLAAIGEMCVLNLNYKTAIDVYRRALDLLDNSRARELGAASVYFGLTAILVSLRRWPEAQKVNDTLLALEPDNLAAQLQRLTISALVNHKQIGKDVGALCDWLRQELESETASAPRRAAIQVAMDALKRFATPADFAKLFAHNHRPSPIDLPKPGKYSKDVMSHLARAQQAMRDLKLQPCLTELRKALRINPTCAEAHVLSAVILALYDRIPESLKHLDTAQKLNPRLGAVYGFRGQILNDVMGNSAEAVQQFELGLKAGLPLSASVFTWGCSMIDVGRGEEVMQYLRTETWGLDPADPDIFAVRAYYYLSLKQYDRALLEADQAVALCQRPLDLGISLRTRADVHVAMGMRERAIEDLEKLCAATPEGLHSQRRARERLAELRAVQRTG